MVLEYIWCGDQMTITIRLTKIEVEMLKELQKQDKRYKKGLEKKVKSDLASNHQGLF